MVDTCAVSFTTRDTLFTLLPGQVVVFRPTGPQLDSAGSVLRVRKAVSVTANGAGAASIALIPGPYLLEAQVDGKLTSVPCTVPDQASATIDACIAAVPSDAQSTVALALIAGNLRFYEDRPSAHSDTTLASGAYFITPNGTAGLTAWKKIPIGGGIFTSSSLGPIFPAYFFPPGNLGAPGMAVDGDADTGIYSLGANRLAGVAGGVMGWDISPTGLLINLPVSGTAVTQTPTDATPGRLLKTGDFGLGGLTPLIGNAGVTTNTIASGLYNYDTTSGSSGGPAGVTVGLLIHARRTAGGGETQTLIVEAGTVPAGTLFTRARTTGAWSAWRAGGGIERGSNANGEFVRYPDGTQICTRTNLSAANANTALGAVFRSADVAWTYPAAFAAAPTVQGDVDDADCWLTTSGAPGTASVNVRALAAVTKGSALTLRATAVGRWF